MSNIEHLTATQETLEAGETQQQLFPNQIDTLFSSIDAQTVEQFYHGYQLWSVERQIKLVQLQIEALEQKIEMNSVEMLQKQPSSLALATLTQLQAYGVTNADLLERMLERGDDWLNHTMQLLAHCEHYNMIGSSYSEWCEHALEGAYDWVESITKITSAELPTPSAQSEEAVIETESLLLQKLMSEEMQESGPIAQPRITRPLAENELSLEQITTDETETTPEASLPLIDTEEMEEGTEIYLLDTSIDAFISALTDGVHSTSEEKPETATEIELATEELVEAAKTPDIQDSIESTTPEETSQEAKPEETAIEEEEQQLFAQEDTSSEATDTTEPAIALPSEPEIDEIDTIIILTDTRLVEQEDQLAIEEQVTISMSVDELHPQSEAEIDEIATIVMPVEALLNQPVRSDEDEYATVAMSDSDLVDFTAEKHEPEQFKETQATLSGSGEEATIILSAEDASGQKVEHEEDGTIFVHSLEELEGASKAKYAVSAEEADEEATIVIRAIQPTQPLIVQRPQREIELQPVHASQPAYYEFTQEQQEKVELERDAQPQMPVSVPQPFQYSRQSGVPVHPPAPVATPAPIQEEKPRRGFWWRVLAFFRLRRR